MDNTIFYAFMYCARLHIIKAQDEEVVIVSHWRKAYPVKRNDLLLAAQTMDFIDNLPTYKSSSKYEADQFKAYENKRDDSCYFFG